MTLLIHGLDNCSVLQYTTCRVQNEIVYASRFIPGSVGFNFPPYSGNANLLVLDENWMFFYNIWCLNIINILYGGIHIQ